MSLLNIEFKTAQGETKTLKDFPAKAYLIVNTASKCGLTPQYEGLQALYKEYKDQGLVILGFPANEFLAQEPGSDAEIQEFCSLNYSVEFPVMSKIVVKGEGQHPLYEELTTTYKKALQVSDEFEKRLRSKDLITGADHDIHWNFEKFLVDADGKIIERYFPDIKPTDDVVISKLKELL